MRRGGAGVRIVRNAGNAVPRHIDFFTEKSCLKNTKQTDKLTSTNGPKKHSWKKERQTDIDRQKETYKKSERHIRMDKQTETDRDIQMDRCKGKLLNHYL